MNPNFAQSIAAARVLRDLLPHTGIWRAARLAIEMTIRELKGAPIGASLVTYVALSLFSLALR
jgi:hypothetical protein